MSLYPNKARLADIALEAGLNRKGLVASCIFPEIEVPSCKFDYIDWTDVANGQGVLDKMRPTDDSVGCYSQVKMIDPSVFEYRTKQTQEHSLKMILKDCCESACTPSGRLPFDKDAKKTQEQTDILLINREIRAINLATDKSAYTPVALNPSNGVTTETTKSEGALYTLTQAQLRDPNFDLLGFFQGIQIGNWETGMRNKMVLDLATLTAMQRHPTFKMGGCAVPPLAMANEIAALLKLKEICVADAAYNSALPGAPIDMEKMWGPFIFLSRSLDMIDTDDTKRGFGFSAFTKEMKSRIYFDEDLGTEGGNVQKIYHDFTEVVTDRKSSTLIELT